MPDNKGWIALHRKIQDHWLWENEPFSKAQAWTDLLISAAYKPKTVIIKEQAIYLERGQQARSMLTLSKLWKWSRPKVKRYIGVLQKSGMIEVKTLHLTTIITICNYSHFQDVGTADVTTGVTSDVTAGVTQTTSKQKNNTNNTNKTAAVANRFVPPLMDDVVNHFADNNCPDHQLLASEFIDYYQKKDWMIDKNKMRDWKAVSKGWINKSKLQSTNQRTTVEDLTDRSWANGIQLNDSRDL